MILSNLKRVKISIAELSDLNEILELQKEAYIQEADIYNNFDIQPLTQKLDSLQAEWRNGTVIKAKKNGQIVGSVRAQVIDNICKIGKLIVKPGFQNQGIGKRLMMEIEKTFDNCLAYELFTGNMSKKNLALYRKLDYKDCREKQIDNNLTLMYLQKKNKK